MSIEHLVRDRVNPGYLRGAGQIIPNDSGRGGCPAEATDTVDWPVFVEEITRQEVRVDEAFEAGWHCSGRWDKDTTVANLLARIATLEEHTGELRQLREADVAQLGKMTKAWSKAKNNFTADVFRNHKGSLSLAWLLGRAASEAYHTNPYEDNQP